MKSTAPHKQPKSADAPAELRHRAERHLSGDHLKLATNRTDAENRRQHHELEVHQIELELQNEELVEARDKLEALLEKYTDLYDFAPVGYLTVDRQGSICEANLTGASLLKTARSALVKQRFAAFVSPADRSVFDGFLQQVFDSRARQECDVRLLVERKRPVDVRLRAIVFESGQGCRMAMTDITEHKLAEAATAQLAAIVKSSKDAIIGKDLNGMVTSWNAGAEKIFGYTADEMLGRPISRLIPSDRQAEEEHLMSRIRKGESIEHFETLRMAKDGRSLDLSVAVSPIRFANGKIAGASTVARDITERKRAEADRLVLNRLESAGILAGGIAHDFNNLLTVVLLNLELAQMLKPPGQELADRLEAAMKTALAARSLTEQFVTFAHGSSPIRKPVALGGVLPEFVRLALSGSNVRCEFSLPDDLWPAKVDEGQIAQVIRNLVLNAREAMPKGGVVFVRAANVVLDSHEQPSLPPGEYVRVSIVDHGGGIPKQLLPKIFDPYFSTKEKGIRKGMGLGLTICHTVIQKHEGAMAVESEVGVGTTFHIYLPAARRLSVGGKASAPAEISWHGRVLVMDDEEEVRKVVGLTLWGMGQEVELVKDGRQAIEAYKKAQSLGRRFDVVILDLTVRAGMGGQETIQALREIDPAVKAIAMSGYVRDPMILEPEHHGFKGTLEKPFDVGQLQEILSRVMSRSPDSKAAL